MESDGTRGQIGLWDQEFSIDFGYRHATLRSLTKYWEFVVLTWAMPLFSPLNKGENGFKSHKQTKHSCDNPRSKQKTKPPSVSGPGWACTFFWHVFFGALAVFHLVTNAHYLEDSWWLLPLSAWQTLHFFFLPYTLWNTWKNSEAKIVNRTLLIGLDQGVRGPTASIVLVWCLGQFFYFREKKSISRGTSRRWFHFKCTLKVFTVNILIPFCFWHQTKSF